MGKGEAAGQAFCPRCGKSVRQEDVICVGCGLNLETGQQVAATAELPEKPTIHMPRFAIWATGLLLLVAVCVVVIVAWRAGSAPEPARAKASTPGVRQDQVGPRPSVQREDAEADTEVQQAVSLELPSQTQVDSLAFSPDGRLLATGNADNTVSLRDVATGLEVQNLTGHKGSVTSVAFSPDGRLLATASTGGRDDYVIRLWDVRTGRKERTLEGHKDDVTCVAFSPDGRVLAAGSDDGRVKLWNVGTGWEVHTFEHNKWGVCSVAFSPDGRLLASGGDKIIKLWEVESGEQVLGFLVAC